jgi:hypothetical protein
MFRIKFVESAAASLFCIKVMLYCPFFGTLIVFLLVLYGSYTLLNIELEFIGFIVKQDKKIK